MFVLEHLKDHKGPQKLVEGLAPVRVALAFTLYILTFIFSQVLEEEAAEFTMGVWRQVIFESMAYGEGLLTEKTLVD